MKEEIKELELLDSEMKDCIYLAGELMDMRNWMEDGYKESPAKEIVNDLLMKKIDKFRGEAQEILDEIIKRKKSLEIK